MGSHSFVGTKAGREAPNEKDGGVDEEGGEDANRVVELGESRRGILLNEEVEMVSGDSRDPMNQRSRREQVGI